MKTKLLKFVVKLVMVLSIFIVLWNGFLLFIAGFVREHNGIELDDDNRKTIVSLMKENVDCYEQIPSIKKATKIEHLALMHKDEITVYYADGTTYSFFIKNYELILYIRNEGYNVYFKSHEFVIDLVKVCIPLTLFLICMVILGRKKLKT